MNPRDNRDELLDTINQICIAIKSTASYPEDHPASREISSKSYETLANLLNGQTTLTVSMFGDKLLVDDVLRFIQEAG